MVGTLTKKVKEDKGYLVQIGEDTFKIPSATSRYLAKKSAAEKFKKKHKLDCNTSDIVVYCANEYLLTKQPTPKQTTKEVLDFLKSLKDSSKTKITPKP